MRDHLVYATPDLGTTVRELAVRFGVPLTPGGSHVGLGTCNFLADLGGGAYLEVIGPDPAQPEPAQPRPFGIDGLTTARLVTWVARVEGLEAAAEQWLADGFDVGPVVPMSRRRVDGGLLSWQLAVGGGGAEFGGLVPGLIDWGGSEHPTGTASRGLRLLSFTGFHPDVLTVGKWLAALGLTDDIELCAGPQPALRAVVETPRGLVELM